jgi:hypothetical protein
MEPCYIFAGFRGSNSQPLIEHLRARAVKHFTRSRRRHPPELLRADRYEDISLPQSPNKLFPFLRPAPVPPARNTEQARTDQNGFDRLAGIEETNLLLIELGSHVNLPGHLAYSNISAKKPGLHLAKSNILE